MRLGSCSRAAEVTQAVRSGAWPDGSEPELRAHVRECRRCEELAMVTLAFQQARATSITQARLGSPGQLWWKAQLRRRNEAVERISRPIRRAQGFALAMYLLLAAGLAVWQWRAAAGWLGILGKASFVAAAETRLIVLVPVLVVVGLSLGLIVYLLAGDEERI